MDSEAMRSDLEAFVNRGLQEGWHGWPTRREADERREAHQPYTIQTIDSRRLFFGRTGWFRPAEASALRSKYRKSVGSYL